MSAGKSPVAKSPAATPVIAKPAEAKAAAPILPIAELAAASLAKSTQQAQAKTVAAVPKAVEAVTKTADATQVAMRESAKLLQKTVAAGPNASAIPLPKPPEFAALAARTLMTQTLTMARTFGALQASMLDHACEELKARLGEVRTLAQTESPSDAVALQAKAVRRGYESYAAHLKTLAQIAGGPARRD